MWRNYICIWQSTFTFIISSGRPRHSAGGQNLHETFHFVDWETEVQPRVTRGWEARARGSGSACVLDTSLWARPQNVRHRGPPEPAG